ncbi:MAG: hypothetical protein RSB76_00125 [Clostridia bacterium]
MPKYYKYKCCKCGYVLDESKPSAPLYRDIDECPKCGKPKTYLEDYDEDDDK